MIASTECSAINGDFSLKARCAAACSLSPIDAIVRQKMDADLTTEAARELQCQGAVQIFSRISEFA